MTVELVTGTFEGRVGDTFAAAPTHSGEPLELELTRCDESPHARPDQPAFSLTFHGPGERRAQQIFKLHHTELGEFELFLVPIAQLEGGIAYEAVIN
jgi:hypothetical protein